MKQSYVEFIVLVADPYIDTCIKIELMIDVLDDATGEYQVDLENGIINFLPSNEITDYMKSTSGSITGLPDDTVYENGNKIIKAIELREKENNLITVLCSVINRIPEVEYRIYFLRRYYYSTTLRQISISTGFSNNKLYSMDKALYEYFERMLFGQYKHKKIKKRRDFIK